MNSLIASFFVALVYCIVEWGIDPRVLHVLSPTIDSLHNLLVKCERRDFKEAENCDFILRFDEV